MYYLDGSECYVSTPYINFGYRWELWVDSLTADVTTCYIKTFVKFIDGSTSMARAGVCPAVKGTARCINKSPTTFTSAYNLQRMRHTWTRRFYIDGNQYWQDDLLPDDNAQWGVEHTGHLHMIANQWYQWGTPYIATWYNDGRAHLVGATAHCRNTVPWNMPASASLDNGSYGDIEKWVQAPATHYYPDPVTINVTGNWYNYKLTWGWVNNARSYTLQAKYNDGDWQTIGDCDRAWEPGDHFAFTPGTTIQYRIITTSDSNDIAIGPATAVITIQGGVKRCITIDNKSIWKNGTVYVKTGGVWKRAQYAMVKTNSGWHMSTY